jgi:CRISPR-associated endonuclease Csy4
MNYYLDITLLPDAEANLGFLWQKVYQQIHLMLVEHKIGEQDSAIAVSFPHYDDRVFPLGNKLRLLGQTEKALNDLNIGQWLSRLDDYVHIKGIKSVPNEVDQFVYFKRKQFKSPDKLRAGIDEQAKKLAAKNNFDVDEVKRRLLASIAKLETESRLPFINVTSLSTDKNSPIEEKGSFKLFIEKEMAKNTIYNDGLFTCYGLSRRSEGQQAAIPWF